ncbi:MAG: HEAT repeat domain-containing protein [Phycisphaerae bacterium]|jgi:HEAT repeat protein
MLFRLALFSSALIVPAAPLLADESIEALMDQFTGRAALTLTTPAELQQAYTRVIDALLPQIAAEKLTDRENPQQNLERICFYASRPGADAERTALCAALCARLTPQTPPPARIWFLRQLERIGGEESVPALAALLADGEAHVRELARRCLQNNPSATADKPLRDALAAATDSEWQIALVNALAARRDNDSIDAFAKLAASPDEGVALAAIAALGDSGWRPAASALERLVRQSESPRRAAAAVALLRTLTLMAREGEQEAAAKLARGLYLTQLPVPVRLAALTLYADWSGAEAIPDLLRVLEGRRDAELQVEVVRILGRMPGSSAAIAMLKHVETATPPVQAALISELAQRPEPQAKSAVINALRSGSAEVRAAALAAMSTVGSVTEVATIAALAASATGAEREAARAALATLRGDDVDAALIAAAAAPGDDAVRAELIAALASRSSEAAVTPLIGICEDASSAVRAAAYRSLAALATGEALPKLVERLIRESDETARAAATDAVVALAGKIDDAERRVQPLLEKLKDASGASKAVLIAALGRIRGPLALAAARVALEDADAAVVDAAVRALADWPDDTVVPDLLDVAASAADETQQVLALRGVVRIVRAHADRPPEESLAILRSVLDAARRDEERKAAVAALGEVRCLDALALARASLATEALRDEAAGAAAALARALAARYPAECAAALSAAAEQTLGTAAHKRVEDAAAFLKRFDGYVGRWWTSPTYTRDGQQAAELFETAFEPEDPAKQVQVKWTELDAASADNPWVFDLARIDKTHDCCRYFRAFVYSETEQPARLEIGADDGVKAWLNGTLVQSLMRVRPVTPGEDKADVTLRAGRNELLLKITQASGGWGFSCGVRARDGGPLAGVRAALE